MVGARAVEMYADQARRRQVANLKQGQEQPVSVPGTLTGDDDAGKAAASAARDVGVVTFQAGHDVSGVRLVSHLCVTRLTLLTTPTVIPDRLDAFPDQPAKWHG